jgi:hypothetical protein
MKVVGLSAVRTGQLYPPGNIPSTYFCLRVSRPQGRSAARRIKSIKNCSDTIGIFFKTVSLLGLCYVQLAADHIAFVRDIRKGCKLLSTHVHQATPVGLVRVGGLMPSPHCVAPDLRPLKHVQVLTCCGTPLCSVIGFPSSSS